MANVQNLKTPTSKQAREYGRKGGIASAKAKKKRKEFKEALLLALQTVKDGQTVQDIGIASVMAKYMDGDLKAFEIIRDTIGEKPTEKQEVKVVETDWFIEDK